MIFLMPLFGDEFMKKEEINDLPELVREYILTYLVAIKNKSQLTVLEYASDLRSFLRYRMIQKGLVSSDANFESISVKNADDGLILNATKDDVYEFISYCASHFFILFRSLNTFVLELCIPVLIFDKSCPEAFVTFALLVSNLPALLQIPLESLRIAQLFK